MLEQVIKEHLEENREKVLSQVLDNFADQLGRSLQYDAKEIVSQAVSDFMNTHIAPEVEARLISQKAEILAAVDSSIVGIATAFAAELQKTVIENMTGYSFKEAMSKLVKGY